jgi:indolepyruvate ferredoxin oxidoreductase beta subunit
MRLVLAGRGGQGIVFATRVLAEAAMSLGQDIICAENHGMAQRGGSILSYVKLGDYASPLIRMGTADLALCFDARELAAGLLYLDRGTTCIVNAVREALPADNLAAAEGAGIAVDAVDANGIAARLGHPRGVNLIVLGRAARTVDGFPTLEAFQHAVRAISARETEDKNLEALGSA